MKESCLSALSREREEQKHKGQPSVASRGKAVGASRGSRYVLKGGLDYAYTRPSTLRGLPGSWLVTGGWGGKGLHLLPTLTLAPRQLSKSFFMSDTATLS